METTLARALAFLCRWGLVAVLLSPGAAQAAAPEVRVAVLEFGTVSWETEVIQHHGLDEAAGVRLRVQAVGSKNAAAVALQSGAVDAIVSDWIWVSRQRGNGRDYVFYPWSMTVGSVMVAPGSGIRALEDLAGRRIGVAGGPVDKSWLLLRALYRARHGEDLADQADPSYGAPPLLNRLARRGDLPAVINYWHYTARLAAAGFRPLIGVESILRELGVAQRVPLLGWVFSESWAREHPQAIRGLLEASRNAKQRLARSKAEWRRLRPLTNAEDERTLRALRERFRAGIPDGLEEADAEAAREVYHILAREGSGELTGGQQRLADGTFWFPPKPIGK